MQRFVTAAIAVTVGLAAFGAMPLLAKQTAATNGPAEMQMSVDGPILTTPAGRTLYLTNENIKAERFAFQCTDVIRQTMNDMQTGAGVRPVPGLQFVKSCVQQWPPYLAAADAKPVGDFSIVDRPGIGKQWMYRNFPLYMSAKDRRPGDRNGLGVGNGGGGNRRGGWSFAALATVLPAGMKFQRHEDGLILTLNERPVYTPRGRNRLLMASAGTADFQPLVAPAIASVKGDWTLIEAGAGRRQFAFKGKALYAAPESMNDFEIAAAGDWEPVVAYKTVGRPADIQKQMSLIGEVYTNKAGSTLYHYTCNVGGGLGGRGAGSTCEDPGDPATYMVALCGSSQQCADRWHPYIAPANARPVGDWSVVDITYPMFLEPRGRLYPSDAPRVKVWAYRGKPLFTYYEDLKPGDIWGDGTKGLWGSNFNAVEVPGRSAVNE